MRSISALALPLLAAAFVVSYSPLRADEHVEQRSRPTSASPAKGAEIAADTGPVTQASSFVMQVIELTNRERLKVGLPALKRQRNLEESSSWMAHDMADRSYFAHNDSGGRCMADRISDFKYSEFSALGENIALGQRTAAEVMEGWMNSPGHRANILSRSFSEIGVAYVPAPHRNGGGGYWVQDFGSRFDRCPVVIDTGCEKAKSSRVKLSIHGGDWVERMRFSNDGVSWTSWEGFRPLREWDLEAGSGKRTVYVEVRQAGHTERLEADITVEPAPISQIARNGSEPRAQ